MLTEELGKSFFEVVNDGFQRLWVPDSDVLKEAESYGADFAKSI